MVTRGPADAVLSAPRAEVDDVATPRSNATRARADLIARTVAPVRFYQPLGETT